jgi:hypothetical protein
LTPELIGTWAGFVLTLMVFSYLLGDNFLYRLAVYVFVGLTAGFVTIVTVESVLLPWIRLTAESADASPRLFGIVPVILGAALIFKISPRFGALGNLGLALMVGVGAAVAVVGAISGTLLPIAASLPDRAGQAEDALSAFNAFLVGLGAICTLIYFQYAARRVPGSDASQIGRGTRRGLVTRALGAVGQGFIVVTLGALYGGAILSGLAVFSERIAFLLARINGG